MAERVSADVTVAQLVDAYGDAVSAAALARGTSRYDDAVANAAGARSAVIAEIERLRKQRDELLDALGDLHDAIMEIAKKADAVIARAEGRR